MSKKKPMIKLEDRSTWPQEIFDCITPNIYRISTERELEQAKNLAGKSWLAAIPDSRYMITRQQLAVLLRGYSIKAYHCTRLLDPEKILQTGLVPLSQQNMTAGLSDALSDFIAPADRLKMEEEVQSYMKSGAFESQQGLLWFYLTEEQTQQYDCQDLLEYYGGRTIRAALQKKRYKFYPLLKRIGTPAVIPCRVQIADGTESQVEELARLILDHILDEAEDRATRPVMGELSINKPVLPKDILETVAQLHLV
jgi:hypothetical protein